MATNMTFYFTGIPCRNGHVAERYLASKQCIECYRTNKAKINKCPKYKAKQKIYRNNTERFRIYGLTNDEHAVMLWDQSGKCKVCKEPETATYRDTGKIKNLAIDHCHKTKKVRGLLCSKCNQAIGLMKHNSEWLRVAALYCEEQ